jgi:hypothetical protein
LCRKDIRCNEGKTKDCRQVATGFISYTGSDEREVIHFLFHGKILIRTNSWLSLISFLWIRSPWLGE